MIGSRSPFLLQLSGPVPLVRLEGDDGVLGLLAPFFPTIWRIRETPGDPYPDAFKLPRLPLPLLMRVARFNRRMSFPRMLPIPPVSHVIAGITRDSSGAALPSCTVHLFLTSTDAETNEVTSGTDGTYTFTGASPALNQYAVAYKSGSPDVAGTTRNDLTGI
jgi:hypothetical protein